VRTKLYVKIKTKKIKKKQTEKLLFIISQHKKKINKALHNRTRERELFYVIDCRHKELNE